MEARVYVIMKQGVLDPQGKAVKSALDSLGFEGLKDVKVGKYFEIKLGDITKEKAMESLKGMCDKLLANPVIEDYKIEILK